MFRHVLRHGALALVALIAAGTVSGGTAGPVRAVTVNSIVVDVNTDNNVADGHCSLREALISANTNSQAHAGATECEAGDDTLEDVITFAQADPFIVLSSPLPTIPANSWVRIKGNPSISASGPIISGADATDVLTVDLGHLVLDKVTIAHASGTTGTAINVVAGTLDIIKGNISANAGSGPGAIVTGGDLSTITIDGATFVHNSVGAVDGSVIATTGTLTASGLILLENNRQPDGNASGIVVDGGNLTLTDSSLTDTQGRGILLRQATADIAGLQIIRSVTPLACAGIQSVDSTLTLADSELFGSESTESSGGGLCVTGPNGFGKVIVKRTSITNNHAATTGAGVVVTGSDVTFANTTISQNVATDDASAISVGGENGHAAGLDLLNVTLAENINNSGTGTAVVFTNASAEVTIQNTIVAGSYPANLGTMPDGGSLTIGDSLVDVTMTGLINSLDSNGGPGFSNLLLATGAAALNAGGDAVCAASPVDGVDQRGLARPAGACDIGALERDAVAPIASAPALRLITGPTLNGSAATARFSWSATDGTGMGVRAYHVQQSVDGGAFADFATWNGKSLNVPLAPGHRYAFRVRAEDFDGNLSGYVATPSYPASLLQQTVAAYTYSAGWKAATSTSFSGGSSKYATTAGASVTFKATGRQFAFVTTTGSTRGKAKIYVNGGLVATVDLRSATTVSRVQAWTATFPTSQLRTIKVVVVGTAGRPRVDVDAFVVLK